LTKPPSILFRCDASKEIGFGHLVRCSALADEIRRVSDTRVVFAMREGTLGVDLRGYEVELLPSNSVDYGAWLEKTAQKFKASVLVVDVRDELSVQELERLKGDDGPLIVILDDLSDRRFAADLVFYPPVPQVRRADWPGFRGEVFVGWEWTILRSQFSSPLHGKSTAGNTLLITMGGSDPGGMTLKAVRALETIEADFAPVIVLGAGFSPKDRLLKLLETARHRFTILENLSDMRTQMLRVDMALCAYGMTAFELAASGVPAVYLCLTKDHAESASALSDAGVGLSLGLSEDVTEAQVAAVVANLLADPRRRAQMSDKARKLIDGKGAARIAQILAERIKKL
jgi:spore coat polysaccharide biosynthesis predicted glycosyltransferase SpsG